MFLPRRPSARVDAAVAVRPRASSSSRYASRPPSEVILAPWNSSLRRRSKATRRALFASPVASAIPHPSGHLYVSDPYSRITSDRQLQVTASGKCGLRRVYDRFNARDIDSALAVLADDVVWANGMDGGHVHGREAVREYWTRQWAMVSPHVEPVDFIKAADGSIVAEVR